MAVAGLPNASGRTAAEVAISLEESTDNAFNAAGALQLVTGVNQDNDINTLGLIATELQAWQSEVTTRENALTAAQTAGNLDTREQEEDLRRAKAARDHVQGELNRLTSIVRNQNRI